MSRISVVIPCFNEEEALPVYYRAMCKVMGEMPEEAKGFPVIPVVIAAAVILVIVLAVVLTRRRKKKRAQAEEEDLADEVDRFTEDE